jgi:hypothetical protein
MHRVPFLVTAGILALSVSSVTAHAENGVAAAQTFLGAHPGSRGMFQGEDLVAVYGPPIASDSNVASSTDDFVNAFLQGTVAAFGADFGSLMFHDAITIRNGTLRVYTYGRQLDGVPVYGSVVKIPVRLGATEEIGYVAAHLVRDPVAPFPADVLTAPEAVAVVARSKPFKHLTTFGVPAKAIYERGSGRLHRTWKFTGSDDDDESYLFFVDTANGQVVGVVNQLLSAGVSGTVSGYARGCCPADNPGYPACCGGNATPELVDLAGARVPVIAGDVPACPGTEGTVIREASTDYSGQYSFTGFSLPARVTTGLDGELATVVDCRYGPSACLSRWVYGGLTGLRECADLTTSGQVDFLLNSAQTEFDVAQVTVHRGVQATHDWFALLQPDFAPIDRNLLCLTNGGYGNAFYDPSSEYLYFGKGGTSPYAPPVTWRNFAMPTVISHEYGHFILDRLLELDPSKLEQGAFHEGVADILSAFLWDTPYMGYDLFVNRDPTFVRRVDEPDVLLNNCASLPSWCALCGESHCTSLALSGAFWDLRERIGDSEAERLFADFLFVTDGRLDASVVAEVLAADEDDDADITNGTVHSPAICEAFGLHGWTCPTPAVSDGSIAVHWQGPAAPFLEPTEGEDYWVYYELDPPHVTLITTEKGGRRVERWSSDGRWTDDPPIWGASVQSGRDL